MPEALLFIKPTLTECKEHLSSPNYGKIGKDAGPLLSFLLHDSPRFCIQSFATAVKCCWKCALCFWSNVCCNVTRNTEYKINVKILYITLKETMQSCLRVFLAAPPLRHRARSTSNHGADGVEVGVEADDFPLSSFCVCVVHGVLERGLPIVVLVDRASCVLRFVCFPGGRERENEDSHQLRDTVLIIHHHDSVSIPSTPLWCGQLQ